MPLAEIARFRERADHHERRPVRVNVIQRGLRVVIGHENRASFARFRVVIRGAFHNMLNHHTQRHVAIGNLLQGRSQVRSVRRLNSAGMVVRLIDNDELRQGI